MKLLDLKLCDSKGAALAMCGFLYMLGMSGSANADCFVEQPPDPSNFTLLIDATSSCSNLNN
ncbi:MAG: hypothetical protein ACR2P6_10150, partial [Gammaproteobacteria bacterium]